MTEANCYKWNYVLIGPSIRVSFNHKQFLWHKTNFRLWGWKFPLYRVCKWKFTGSTSLNFILTCLKRFCCMVQIPCDEFEEHVHKSMVKNLLAHQKIGNHIFLISIIHFFNTNTISTTKSIIICTKQSSWVLYPSIVYNVSS